MNNLPPKLGDTLLPTPHIWGVVLYLMAIWFSVKDSLFIHKPVRFLPNHIHPGLWITFLVIAPIPGLLLSCHPDIQGRITTNR